MLVDDGSSLELALVGTMKWTVILVDHSKEAIDERKSDIVRRVNLLEDVLESTVVDLEDGVLAAQVKVLLLGESELEAAVSKSSDGL